ncbi:hypothetical protein [Fodinicola feengrottensis]|uniref:hypothetical protein n=1 Tax=Fodinicola feengrottensis TaxID=435914 RepID=UPI0013D0A78B|nr:hypothetical protein [Fodinicola feengrottensis]
MQQQVSPVALGGLTDSIAPATDLVSNTVHVVAPQGQVTPMRHTQPSTHATTPHHAKPAAATTAPSNSQYVPPAAQEDAISRAGQPVPISAPAPANPISGLAGSPLGRPADQQPAGPRTAGRSSPAGPAARLDGRPNRLRHAGAGSGRTAEQRHQPAGPAARSALPALPTGLPTLPAGLPTDALPALPTGLPTGALPALPIGALPTGALTTGGIPALPVAGLAALPLAGMAAAAGLPTAAVPSLPSGGLPFLSGMPVALPALPMNPLAMLPVSALPALPTGTGVVPNLPLPTGMPMHTQSAPAGLGLPTTGLPVSSLPALPAVPGLPGLPGLSGMPGVAGLDALGSAPTPTQLTGGITSIGSKAPELAQGIQYVQTQNAHPVKARDGQLIAPGTGGLPVGLAVGSGVMDAANHVDGGIPGMLGMLSGYVVVPTQTGHEIEIIDAGTSPDAYVGGHPSSGVLGDWNTPLHATALAIDSGRGVQQGAVTQGTTTDGGTRLFGAWNVPLAANAGTIDAGNDVQNSNVTQGEGGGSGVFGVVNSPISANGLALHSGNHAQNGDVTQVAGTDAKGSSYRLIDGWNVPLNGQGITVDNGNVTQNGTVDQSLADD